MRIRWKAPRDSKKQDGTSLLGTKENATIFPNNLLLFQISDYQYYRKSQMFRIFLPDWIIILNFVSEKTNKNRHDETTTDHSHGTADHHKLLM